MAYRCIRFSILFFALCVLSAFIGCDGHTRLAGHVVDQQGMPIANAVVALEIEDEKAEVPVGNRVESMTGADGSFEVGLTHAPTRFSLMFTVAKGGYRTHREEVPSGTYDRARKVILDPD